MRELLEELARRLVDRPEEVSVEQFTEDDGTVVLELAVAEDDYGKIIGKGGRIAAGPRRARDGRRRRARDRAARRHRRRADPAPRRRQRPRGARAAARR